ncbi:MAG: hypothetical protein ABEI80_05320 [Haloplanus sp.]
MSSDERQEAGTDWHRPALGETGPCGDRERHLSEWAALFRTEPRE